MLLLHHVRRTAGLLTGLLCVAVSPSPAQFADAAREQFATPSRFAPPVHWTGPRFEPNFSFPPEAPLADDSAPWLSVDFQDPAQAAEYMQRVLRYIYEGNIGHADEFRVQANSVRSWYHAPWMHSGDGGREPIHGLTRERAAPPKFLHDDQTRYVQNWAVSIYNAPGGYAIGQAWKDVTAPDSQMPRFPLGTVSAKLLFTNATADEVPYLDGSVEWDAMIQETGPAPQFQIRNTRVTAPVKMRLLQLDVAVRDARAQATTGWVFGTFVYNAALRTPGDTAWDRMMPVGIAWGNDPEFQPDDEHPLPAEQWLNPAAESLLLTSVRKELGYQRRVNGPVDNPRSSCLSCHGTAQDPPAPIMFERRNATDDPFYAALPREFWFRNLSPADPFKPGAASLDYSLQLAVGIANFRDWKARSFPDEPTSSPTTASAPTSASAALGAARARPGPRRPMRAMIDRGDEEFDAPDDSPRPDNSAAVRPLAPTQPLPPIAGGIPLLGWIGIALAGLGLLAILFRGRTES